jgi:hypothetical protein
MSSRLPTGVATMKRGMEVIKSLFASSIERDYPVDRLKAQARLFLNVEIRA